MLNMATTPLPVPTISIPQTLQWLWPFWRSLPGRIGLLLGLTPVCVAFDVYIPQFLRTLIDQLGKTSITTGMIQQAALLILLFGVLHMLIYTLVQSLRGATNVRLENDFRVHVFRHLVGLGQRFFQKFPTGDLLTRLIDDTSEHKLGWFACSGVFRLYEALLRITGCLLFMLFISWPLTLMTVIPLGLMASMYIFTSHKTTAFSRRTQVAISELNQFLTNSFDGIRIVKAYNQQSRQEKGFDAVVEQQLQKELAQVKMASLLELSYARFSELLVVLLFIMGGWLVIHQYLTLGALVAFNSYIAMLLWPMVDIGQFFIKGRGAGVCVQRLKELVEFQPDVTQAAQPQHLSLPLAEFSFKQVSYHFPNGQAGLHELTFTLKPRQTTALAGTVGSGKSTLLALLPRLIDPQMGMITLNHQDLRDYEIASLRQHMAVVTQEPILFSDTIRENIIFGRQDISETELNEAIRVAQLQKDLPHFSQGLDTVIGSKGIKLSGGQKQRLALARALVKKPTILILDDCTSALDAETEAKLWQALYEFIPGLLVVLVTHRISTLQKADQILVLQNGRLRQTGQHDDLLNTSEYYRELYGTPPEPIL